MVEQTLISGEPNRLEAELEALLRHAPKQARSVERVNLILITADRLFGEAGYDGVTTNQIAAQAGIPIGSLYQFFQSKAAILQALAVRYRAGLNALFQHSEPSVTTIGQAAEHFMTLLFHFGSTRWGFTRILLMGSTSPETKPAIVAIQQELVRHLKAAITPYLTQLSSPDRHQVATIAATAFQALLAHAVTVKTSDGYEAMHGVFTQTKLMIIAYVERVATMSVVRSPESSSPVSVVCLSGRT